jgi:hypothetical protein
MLVLNFKDLVNGEMFGVSERKAEWLGRVVKRIKALRFVLG